jgi:adenylate cyclase
VDTAKGEMATATLHALTARQLAAGVAPDRPAWAGFAEGLSAIFIGSLAALAVVFLPGALAAGSTILLALLGFLGAFFLFRSTGLLLDPSPAVLASFGAPLAVGATVLVNMVVRDDAVRGAFHGALPQKAMTRLQRHGGSKLLHGVHRDVTVLSCAFHLPRTLVKQFEGHPKDYVLFKASANDRLRRTILDHDGTVDYGEDGRLLGYWNVPMDEPKHVELACACALKMLDDVSAISQQVAESQAAGPMADFEELADGRIEIGIATGPCFAGPVGLGGRNRYAALGQPVSFAGRLRARSALYGPAILTDSRVHEALRHHYAFLDLDFVRRDAETAAEMIYGLVGNPFLKASKNFRTLSEAQRDLLIAWRDRDLTAATRQLQLLRGMPGVPQPYVELFERRIMNARLQRSRRDDDQAEVLGP